MKSLALSQRVGYARILAGALLAAALGASNLALGQPIPRDGSPVVGAYIPSEIALLPKYCTHTMTFRENLPGGNDRVEIERWYSIMGPTFHHMHHYCYGLMNSTRALLATDTPTRMFYLHNAVAEFDYVLQGGAIPQDFILLPELLAKRGDSLLRMGRIALGLESLERALQVKVDYWPAYVRIGDYYADAGDFQNAREAFKRGLVAVPESKTLHQRLEELDRRSASVKPQSGRAAKAGPAIPQRSPKDASRSGDVTR